ncbi:hypothetical protein BDR04DRAFT_1122809 [Suillus decipiens]|nr:hypothetical protein BDR04DRAFT_1122809 [Suillus decipiens]
MFAQQEYNPQLNGKHKASWCNLSTQQAKFVQTCTPNEGNLHKLVAFVMILFSKTHHMLPLIMSTAGLEILSPYSTLKLQAFIVFMLSTNLTFAIKVQHQGFCCFGHPFCGLVKSTAAREFA